MNINNMKEANLKFSKAPDKKCCSGCGEEMKEVDRCNESGVLFVWYECGKDNCDGQWLQKIPQKFQSNSVSDISQ